MWYIESSPTEFGWPTLPDSVHFTSNDGIVAEYVPRRFCRIVPALNKLVLSDGTEVYEDGCSECGEYVAEYDRYCPGCGAEVVE